ncbi:MAG: C25 family cysteine peptidase [Acidobacteriota bacterium]
MNPGKKLSFKRPFYSVIAAAFLALAFLNMPGFSSKANKTEINPDPSPTASYTPFATSGSTALYTLQGGGAGTANGDYVTASAGMDEVYRYFIEVPSGLTRLQIELFDADIGLGGSGEATAGRDRSRAGGDPDFNTSATYSLIDPSGTSRTVRFTTGNSSSPTGADNAWLTLYNGTGNNVADNFGTAAYTNNDGNNNWSTNWIESSDDGSATSGAIQITGGELRLQDGVAGTPSIQREVDLPGSPGLNLAVAYFSFTYRTSNNLEDSDQISVQVSSNGGSSWTTLETFSNDSSGSRQYDITSFIEDNTRVRFLLAGGYTGTEFFFVDNLQIHDGGAITAGHWELRIDQSSSVTTGDDINAIGIRAHDGTAGSGGTELNVYYDSHNGYGVNPPSSGSSSRSYDIYPFITSGCSCAKNDFDYDSNSGNTGSMAFTSRLGAFTQNYSSSSLSANDLWRRDSFSGWTNDTASTDYGIWSNALTITTYVSGGINGNYTNFYMSNYQAAANPPTVNPTSNAFRVYLPTDSGTAPVKPYLEQYLTYFSGTNPPTTGQQTVFTVTIRMINQTGNAITFSSSNLVTANVPGSGATYGGSAAATQGTIVSQPSVGGTGNITWNPGTINGGSFAVLTYRVRVTPTAAGQRVPVTATPASGNGTRAQYVDETGNTTQSRATYLFGPICELAATEGTLGPSAVDDVEMTATAFDDGVHIEWKTGFEVDNLGFNIYRDENGERTLINDQLIAGSALMAGDKIAMTAGMQYSWWDALVGDKQNVRYWIEDVDLNGTATMRGPFHIEREQGKAPSKNRSVILSALGAGSSTQEQAREQSQEQPLEVKQTISAKASRARASAQIDLASARAVKLSIREDGWYRVKISDLIAAGLNPNFNPQFLQLSVGGREQALLLSGAGETAAIEFYATGQDNPYTDARTYWITAGNQPGQRINIINAPGEAVGPQSFPFTTEYKERSVYFSALRNGDDENFFGRAVTPAGATQQIVLKNVDTAFTGTALIKVSLQGVTEFPGPIDHQVLVRINGVEVGRFTFDGRQRAAGTFPVEHSLLREQSNTITMVSEAGGGDVSLFDYIRITYQHKLRADNDSLRFTLGSQYQTESVSSNPRLTTVEDFTTPLIRVFDITNPASPVEMAGRVSEAVGGKYRVTFEAMDSSTRTFLAITADKFKSPVSIRGNQPSNLRATHNQAEMIIITHSSLLAAIAPLKTMRENQKLSVVVVDVEDIYDEFNLGERSPKAIKDFLQTASRSWKKAPRFVLIVGDATYDPKRYLGGGDFDLVPSKLVDVVYLETASDDWFTDFNNDGVADIAIGRLPARTSDEASRFIAKLVAYEKAAASPTKRKALLVADRNDGFNFENATAQLRPLLPSGTAVQEVFRSKTTDAQMSVAITQAINSGVSVVNFAGHGSTGIWRGNVFDVQAAKALRNNKALPMVVSMTCLNGYFHDPVIESLAEALLNAEGGGAIAVWASSSLTDPRQQAAVNQALYRQMFAVKGQAATVGEAVMRAKAATANMDVRQTWVLFGDPATRLK